MKNLLLFFTAFLFSINVQSQFIKNEVIVKSNLPLKSRNLNIEFTRNNVKPNVKILNQDLGLYGLYFENEVSEIDLKNLQSQHGIISAGYNIFLDKRIKPNDSLYSKQWAIEFSKIDKVWDVTTGGKTKDDKQIVVGILDDGVDIAHSDLKNNIFINTNEIADDEIDNDGNGYIDDYQGYNVDFSNGKPLIRMHGTGVAGIIGATGNNTKGVSGINWNIKILPVVGINKLDEIIQGYTYLLKMKRLYNNTNGEKGAFILVTNYSGGISKVFGNVEPYRSWCELYDLLGLEGVLSVGATDNENVNVGLMGDMPTTCTSEYFISTTNIDQTGTKILRAAYSKEYVTIAAPGEGLSTLDTYNKYEKDFSGTSAAAPMVAGTLALLFSVPCAAFSKLINEDRAMAAIRVKNALRDGVKHTSALESHTKWGGYIDAESAFSYIAESCDGDSIIPSPKGPLQIKSFYELANQIIIEYATPEESSKYTVVLYDLLGRIVFKKQIDVPAFGKKQIVIDEYLQLKGLFGVSIYTDKASAGKLFYFGL